MSARENILKTAEALGLSMSCEFVPFSLSRNKGEKSPSLNWKLTILLGAKIILRTDYSAGWGHCPSYKQGRLSVDEDKAIRLECERGIPSYLSSGGAYTRMGGKPIVPDFADVLHSLASDADALDAGSFEEWARDLGYDEDSRSAEQTYRACLDIGLRLRAAIGDEGLTRLREACQDY